MPFCENCGIELSAGNNFCENCGEKVFSMPVFSDRSDTKSQNDSPMTIFKDWQWQEKWQRFVRKAQGRAGIILTREKRLLNELYGVSAETIHAVIGNYIENSASAGIYYAYLDVEDCFSQPPENLDSLLSVLKKIVAVAAPRYLFIIGNEKIIETAFVENNCDADRDVASDLVFSVLRNFSASQAVGRISPVLQVGRLPVFHKETADGFRRYFETVASIRNWVNPAKNYCLSAWVWHEMSEKIYRTFSSNDIDISPETTVDNVDRNIPRSTGLYFFNLHGSSNSGLWYGQKGTDYPEAFSPRSFNGNRTAFVLAVEACYGARCSDGIGPGESILLQALVNGCVSFLASSRIAYGKASGDAYCADVIAGEFLYYISRGAAAGDAYFAGIKKITAKGRLDDAEIKTILEFALYGDPALVPCGSFSKSFVPEMPLPDISDIELPDVVTPVNLILNRVNEKIEKIVNTCVHKNFFPEMDEYSFGKLEQRLFWLPDVQLNHKSFTVQGKIGPRIVKVYFDNEGNIKRVYESK